MNRQSTVQPERSPEPVWCRRGDGVLAVPVRREVADLGGAVVLQGSAGRVFEAALGGATEAGATFARHLGALPGGAEDPFTGSATGGMAAYLWHYGLIDSPTFSAEQGHWMGRPGIATVEVVGTRDAIETVKVGGEAVTVLRGELDLERAG